MPLEFLSIIQSDRGRELMSKIRVTDTTNEQQIQRLTEDYKDVLDALSGREQHLPVAEQIHPIPISEDNLRQSSNNTRPLPHSLKELQKRKYAAVKAYSRYPTPENKDIMQALNRETKQKIAEFKRTGNKLTVTKPLPNREVRYNIDPNQISRFAEKDMDDEDTGDENTDSEGTDGETMNYIHANTEKKDKPYINESYDDNYDIEDIAQENTNDDETEGELMEDESTGNEETTRHNAGQLMSTKNTNDKHTGEYDTENEDIQNGSSGINNFHNQHINNEDSEEDFDNDDTDDKVMDKVDSVNETKYEYRRRLSDEYKDVIDWAGGLCARALRAYAYTAEGTSQHAGVPTEKWSLSDVYMSARLKIYMSKIETNFTTEERCQKARFCDGFMKWILNLEENLLCMFLSPEDTRHFINPETKTQTMLQNLIYDALMKYQCSNPSHVEDTIQPQSSTESTTQLLPSDQNINQPLTFEDTNVEDTNYENTGGEDTENVDTNDVDTGDEGTTDEDTGDEDKSDGDTGDTDTNEGDTDDEDTVDEDAALPQTKNTAQFLSPVLNTRRPLAENACTTLPSSENTNRWPRQVENANQHLPSVASTSRCLPAHENTSLNSKGFQPPIRDPLPPALKELQRRKNIALREYSQFPSPDNKRVKNALTHELKRAIAEFRRTGYPPAATGDKFEDFCAKLKVIDMNNETLVQRLAYDYKDVLELYFSHGGTDNNERLTNLFYQEYTRRADPSVASTSQAPANPNVLPPALNEVLKRKRAALMVYRGCRTPENKGILRLLEKEVKQGLAEFRRMQPIASIGDRFDDFCIKLKVMNLNSRAEMHSVVEDYKDVLETYFHHGAGYGEEYSYRKRVSDLFYHESTQRVDPRVPNASVQQRPSRSHLPPALQELLRRKHAALMIYRAYPVPENKVYLRTLDNEVKRGFAEFRRM